MADTAYNSAHDRLLDLLYGECAPAEEAELRRQIASDADLAAQWEELQADHAAVAQATPELEDLPPAINEAILEAAADQAPKASRRQSKTSANNSFWSSTLTSVNGRAWASVAIMLIGSAVVLTLLFDDALRFDDAQDEVSTVSLAAESSSERSDRASSQPSIGAAPGAPTEETAPPIEVAEAEPPPSARAQGQAEPQALAQDEGANTGPLESVDGRENQALQETFELTEQPLALADEVHTTERTEIGARGGLDALGSGSSASRQPSRARRAADDLQAAPAPSPSPQQAAAPQQNSASGMIGGAGAGRSATGSARSEATAEADSLQPLARQEYAPSEAAVAEEEPAMAVVETDADSNIDTATDSDADAESEAVDPATEARQLLSDAQEAVEAGDWQQAQTLSDRVADNQWDAYLNDDERQALQDLRQELADRRDLENQVIPPLAPAED